MSKITLSIIIGTVIALGGGIWWVIVSHTPATRTSNSVNAKINQNANPAAAYVCPFPVTNAPELAASYGVPEGWQVEKSNGTLAIMEDERNLTAAFVYTAKLEKDLSAETFLNQFGKIFDTAVTDAGGSFSLGQVTVTGNTATASAQASVSEGDLQGVFATSKDPGFVTFTAYWAPVDTFAAKEATLQDVVHCYTRSTSLTDAQLTAAATAKQAADQENTAAAQGSNPWGAFSAGSDGAFSFQAPASWTSNANSAGESSGLALDAPGSDASVAFLYNLGRYGAADPEEFARTTMAVTYGIQATLSNHQTVDGVDVYDFHGTFSGKDVNGAVAVRIEPYQTFFAHYLGVMIANADKWTTYAPTLNQIQASIRLTDAGQELSSLPDIPNYDSAALFGENAGAGSSVTSSQSYKDAVDDQASQNWEDAMLGFQTMESPSTGDHYDVPLNSYNPTGPNGGGYYRKLPGGGLEQLSPVQ